MNDAEILLACEVESLEKILTELLEDKLQQTKSLYSFIEPDFNFELFKFDGVCGTLRRNKRKYFCEMMQNCRKYCPDLILLNHRLDFGSGNKYATTFLWEAEKHMLMCFL